MAVIDHIIKDSPTNNFATCNPLANGGTLEEGNLRFKHVGNNATKSTLSTFSLPNSGTYYWEIYEETAIPNNSRVSFGICNSIHASKATQSEYIMFETDSHGFTDRTNVGNPSFVVNGNGVGTFNTDYTVNYGSGGVISFYVNMDTNEFTVGRNNTAYKTYSFTKNENIFYTPFFNLYCEGSQTLSQVINFGQDATFAGVKSDTAGPYSDANGIGKFYYQPPTGALALCTRNIPTPSMNPDVGNGPEDFFKCVTWSGNSNDNRPITTGFQSDLIWLKARTHTNPALIFDSVRGFEDSLSPSQTTAEGGLNDAAFGYISAAGQTDFTIKQGTTNSQRVNETGRDYVAWCWKAGGAPSGATSATGSAKRINTSGTQDDTSCNALATAASATITPTLMSINQQVGFSIATYSIPSSTANNHFTISHGLNKTPEVIIVKCTVQPGHSGSQMWMVYHHSEPTKAGYLNRDLSFTTTALSENFNNTVPTSQVFTVGHPSNNNSGDTCRDGNSYVAYAWHSVPGYSAFGLYTGNGDNDNDDDPDPPFIYTGFSPAFVWIKSISNNTGWYLFDNARSTHNENDNPLRADASTAESSVSASGYKEIDLLSNGFKIRNDRDQINSSSHTYLYCAWAEQNFKYTTAR